MIVGPFNKGLEGSLLCAPSVVLQDHSTRQLKLSFSQYVPDPKTGSGLENGKGIMTFVMKTSRSLLTIFTVLSTIPPKFMEPQKVNRVIIDVITYDEVT